MKIGLIGLGNIGSELNNFIISQPEFELTGIYDVDAEKKTKELDELIEKSDLLVEAAHPSIVPEILKKCADSGKDIMIMSTGGLIGIDIPKNIKVYLPSGAISGIDAIRSAAIGGIDRITLTTTKPSKSLGMEIKEKTVIFEGSVEEAVKKYPKNINVSATLTLASGADVIVKIVADPDVDKNTHEIVAEGSFGRITTKTENVPSPNNPKTSYLAVLSAKACLKNIISNVQIGN